MRVMICGIDGYIGWPLALHLAKRGHVVGGIDNGNRREWVKDVGSDSAIPIAGFFHDRAKLLNGPDAITHPMYICDLQQKNHTRSIYWKFRPDAIVYLGEQPSAPFSQIDFDHAELTWRNNTVGTMATLWAMNEVCPDAHLVKLGTMGEYGTPNKVIPESGPHEFPRQPGSFYHSSKCADSINVECATRFWGITATDVHQGVVYGTRIDAMNNDPSLATRFDFDECFGTVVNRMCAQAVAGIPLTVYGQGTQIRSFLPLRDSIQCLTLLVENPPNKGEFRTVNQFDQPYSINELAESVKTAAAQYDIAVSIYPIDNPRVEAPEHFYQPVCEKLPALGYNPTGDLHGQLVEIIGDLIPHRDRILAHKDAIMPKTRWR